MNEDLQGRPAGIDIPILCIVLILVTIGLAAIYDVTWFHSWDNWTRTAHTNTLYNLDTLHYLKRQTLGAVIGVSLMLLLAYIPIEYLRRMALPLILGAICLLCAVWIPPLGIALHGAHRWVKIGVNLQPSLLAQFCLILFLASALSDLSIYKKRMILGTMILRNRWARDRTAILFLAVVVLIEREPDLGTAIITLLTGSTILYLAGVSKRQLILLTCLGIIGIVSITYAVPYRYARFISYLHPDTEVEGIGFQPFHWRMAIASGGLLGKGIGNSAEKFVLPEVENDSIFAVLAEETGILGCLVLMALFALLAWRMIRLMSRIEEPFLRLLVGGVVANILWQVIENIASVSGCIPALGIQLPFISYGSTSLIVLLASMGLVLNISRNYPLVPSAPAGKQLLYIRNIVRESLAWIPMRQWINQHRVLSILALWILLLIPGGAILAGKQQLLKAEIGHVRLGKQIQAERELNSQWKHELSAQSTMSSIEQKAREQQMIKRSDLERSSVDTP